MQQIGDESNRVCTGAEKGDSSAPYFFCATLFQTADVFSRMTSELFETVAIVAFKLCVKEMVLFSEWTSLLKTAQNTWRVHPLFRHFEYKHKTTCFKLRHTGIVKHMTNLHFNLLIRLFDFRKSLTFVIIYD